MAEENRRLTESTACGDAHDGRKPASQAKRALNRLSAAFVWTVSKPGRYGDGHGLYLLVQPTGSKQWIQRIFIHGRRRELGLGGFPLTTLAEAREAALANRRLARKGGDPLADKRAAAVPTFEEAARAYIEMQRPAWSNAKHAGQWTATLETYAFPRLGNLPVNAIDTADVLAALKPAREARDGAAREAAHRRGAQVSDGVRTPARQPGRRGAQRDPAETQRRREASSRPAASGSVGGRRDDPRIAGGDGSQARVRVSDPDGGAVRRSQARRMDRAARRGPFPQPG